MLALGIEDDRPGLSEAALGEFMRVGARLDEHDPSDDPGFGLVDELVRAYGGTLTLLRGNWGGLRVQVRLPGALSEG